MIHYRKILLTAALTAVALLLAIGGFIAGVYEERLVGIPLWLTEDEWSIGIYVGESPFRLSPLKDRSNPVLTARNVTDLKAGFVADPFMVKENSNWYLFFEVLEDKTLKGKIGLASSEDGFHWKYEKIIIDEPFHLSYPYVFNWQDTYYMIPESSAASAIRLYKATNFPREWSFLGSLLTGSYVDSSIFHYKGKWWLFTAEEPGNKTLRLFYADDLLGDWTEHPYSPIIKGDAHTARPGGRVLVLRDQILRYAQDDDPDYGNQLRAFQIDELTTTAYHEQEGIPVLKGSGSGWNAHGMHHVDPHQVGDNLWIACVDGNQKRIRFRLKY